MSGAHTPGLWFVPIEAAGSNGTQVWARGGDVRVANCDSGGISLEGKRRDARLIAAAPDLLAIVETIAKLLNEGAPSALILDENSPTRDAIRDALARAAA